MTSAIAPSDTTPSTNPVQTPKPDSNTDLTGKDVFLKLLVAQLKNQDPLNPMDGMSFVTQLAQFSQLDALFGIRSDLEAALATGAVSSQDQPNVGTSQPAQ